MSPEAEAGRAERQATHHDPGAVKAGRRPLARAVLTAR